MGKGLTTVFITDGCEWQSEVRLHSFTKPLNKGAAAALNVSRFVRESRVWMECVMDLDVCANIYARLHFLYLQPSGYAPTATVHASVCG